MKFVCLVYIDPAKIAAMTPAEGQRLIDATIEEDWEARRLGKLIYAQPLDEPVRARTLRADGSTTDGPFAETKEHLGGFTIIEAASLEEAIALNRTSAILPYGSIEIRPILEQTHSVTGENHPGFEARNAPRRIS